MIEGVTTAVLDAPSVGWAPGALGAVQAADRELSRSAALRYRAVAAFALTRPASADRPQGTPGAMSAQRWAARADVLRQFVAALGRGDGGPGPLLSPAGGREHDPAGDPANVPNQRPD